MATEAIELDKDAFMRLVTEGHLQVEGPSAGYLYTGRQGKSGWELYKTANNPWYIWQMHRILTQTNGAGGALQLNIAMPAGVVGKLVALRAVNSGTNTVYMYRFDEDAALVLPLAAVASAAGTSADLPSVGGAASAAGNLVNTCDMWFGSGEYMACLNTLAGLQNDTLTVAAVFLLSQNQEPIINTTGSGGTPVLGDNTVSLTNRMQLAAMP